MSKEKLVTPLESYSDKQKKVYKGWDKYKRKNWATLVLIAFLAGIFVGLCLNR